MRYGLVELGFKVHRDFGTTPIAKKRIKSVTPFPQEIDADHQGDADDGHPKPRADQTRDRNHREAAEEWRHDFLLPAVKAIAAADGSPNQIGEEKFCVEEVHGSACMMEVVSMQLQVGLSDAMGQVECPAKVAKVEAPGELGVSRALQP